MNKDNPETLPKSAIELFDEKVAAVCDTYATTLEKAFADYMDGLEGASVLAEELTETVSLAIMQQHMKAMMGRLSVLEQSR